jgi:hypothetical protein
LLKAALNDTIYPPAATATQQSKVIETKYMVGKR